MIVRLTRAKTDWGLKVVVEVNNNEFHMFLLRRVSELLTKNN